MEKINAKFIQGYYTTINSAKFDMEFVDELQDDGYTHRVDPEKWDAIEIYEGDPYNAGVYIITPKGEGVLKNGENVLYGYTTAHTVESKLDLDSPIIPQLEKLGYKYEIKYWGKLQDSIDPTYEVKFLDGSMLTVDNDKEELYIRGVKADGKYDYYDYILKGIVVNK